MPRVTCSCGAKLNVTAEKIGETGDCPKCGKTIDLTPDSIKAVVEGSASSKDDAQPTREGDWICLQCKKTNPKELFVCRNCRQQHPNRLLPEKPRRLSNSGLSPDTSPSISGVALTITVLGYFSIPIGLIMAVIGVSHLRSTTALTLGISAAISGILMVGFGAAIEYLAKIESHLRNS
jgi:hypothetical protein